MSKNKHQSNLTRQKVRDLNYLKGPSLGRRLSLPTDGMGCDHHGTVREIDSNNGISQCQRCRTTFGYDGLPI